MCDEITYPFPNVSSAAVLKFGNDKLYHSTLYWACDYFFIPWSKLIRVIERGTGIWRLSSVEDSHSNSATFESNIQDKYNTGINMYTQLQVMNDLTVIWVLKSS